MGPRIREDKGERRQAPALRSMGPRMREDKGGKIGGDTGAHEGRPYGRRGRRGERGMGPRIREDMRGDTPIPSTSSGQALTFRR